MKTKSVLELNDIAFDRSARSFDANGFLHVEVNNISKANVCPYYGAEIPGSEKLGLDPKRIYYMLRDPAELAKAADTFNNIPLVNQHVPIYATEVPKEFIVGTTGTDARFIAPYLKNSLTIWEAGAIEGVESREQVELSCGYSYVADMTPGTYEGVAYDGVMRNIKGNHVALVDVGRAGPDVLVGDHQLKEGQMAKKKLGARARAARSILTAFLKPRLAADQQLKVGELDPIITTLANDRAGFKKQVPQVVKQVSALTKDRLATDMDLDPNELAEVLEALGDDDDGLEEDGNPAAKGMQPPPKAKDDGEEVMDSPGDMLMQLLQGLNLPDEVMQQVSDLLSKMPKGADAAPPNGTKSPDDKLKEESAVKPAMDKKAIQMAKDEAVQTAVERVRAINEATREVEPILGTIAGMDSAEDIYKMALDEAGIDTRDVHPTAFRHLVKMHLKSLEERNAPKSSRLGQDAAPARDAYSKRYGKNATRVGRA